MAPFADIALAAAGMAYTANFSHPRGTSGCTFGALQCPVALPGVYEALNYKNLTIRSAHHPGTDQFQDLVPSSIFYYAGMGFENSQATIDITKTNTTSFDMRSLYFGCNPADYADANQGVPVSYPEYCTMTVKGFKQSTDTSGVADAVASFKYAPVIQYNGFGEPYAEMGLADFSNSSAVYTGDFEGIKALTFTVANRTGQPTFLGIDDVSYIAY